MVGDSFVVIIGNRWRTQGPRLEPDLSFADLRPLLLDQLGPAEPVHVQLPDVLNTDPPPRLVSRGDTVYVVGRFNVFAASFPDLSSSAV